MIEALIFNVAVTISGIYLFHRLQFYEDRSLNFSKNYIALLMTLISILLLTYPLSYGHVSFNLAFVPLLFIGRYTNTVYTVASSIALAILEIFLFHGSLTDALTLIVIAIIVGTIGPFINQTHFASIQWLNAIALVVIAVSCVFRSSWDFYYLAFIIVTSYILSICSTLIFNDIWRISKLMKRYEDEESTDYLTGLGNVREFDRVLNTISRNTNHSIGLLLIDIDGFKDVNDRYGHTAGDAVLRQMAQVLTNYVASETPTFRNGGEEFSVILVDYTLDESIKLAESIRQGVKDAAFHLPNKETISLTVSIGVGYLQEEEIKSHRKIFKDADDMLHAAKEQGSNLVMFNPIIK